MQREISLAGGKGKDFYTDPRSETEQERLNREEAMLESFKVFKENAEVIKQEISK